MAFTETDTDCLVQAHDYLIKRKQSGRIDATEQGHLETIVKGDEAAKILVAKWYAENHTLVHIDARLARIDAEKTALETEKTTL
ncbi:MAG: hypothetical protein V3V75_08110, partial [Thermoguttaceae bacterium]